MGNSSDIDLSVANVYRSWYLFRRGKQPSWEIETFQFNLEANIFTLARDLQNGTYEHGSYRHFVVQDNKKRVVAVASVRDRLVHRLPYEYLVPIWDRHFVYDVWSYRPGKGLLTGIQRTQDQMNIYHDNWLWRADVAKFFDNINHDILRDCLKRRIFDKNAHFLLDKVINSYSHNESVHGLPIGNLTSQILANVYLNEFDRFVLNELKPLGYVRYGDDFILWGRDERAAVNFQTRGTAFLQDSLGLSLHATNHTVQPTTHMLHFLGIEFWPSGHRLDKRMRSRIANRVRHDNQASYEALLKHHGNWKAQKQFLWDNLSR